MGLGAWDGWLSLFEELTLTEINHNLLLYPSPGSRKLLVDFRIPKLLVRQILPVQFYFLGGKTETWCFQLHLLRILLGDHSWGFVFLGRQPFKEVKLLYIKMLCNSSTFSLFELFSWSRDEGGVSWGLGMRALFSRHRVSFQDVSKAIL